MIPKIFCLKPSRPRLQRLGLLFFAAVVLGPAFAAGNLHAQAGRTTPLYPVGGVKAEAVRQGKLGSCYFHSVIAALAHSNPEMIRKMIQENNDGTFTVRFADGKKEHAYPEDIRYSRESGYDLSQGLWVAVLFRAYTQRVLREAQEASVDQAELFALVTHYAEDLIASNDSVLIAYDRAIRAVVDQNGNINRTRLEAKLREQLKPIAVPDDVKNSLVSLLQSGGFFASMEGTIKQNGELFGAYRAVGQGGIAERVMETFGGSKQTLENESEDEAAQALGRASSARSPVVACTGASRYHKLLLAHQSLPPNTGAWYIDGHCYTVMKFDGEDQLVTLRNPWADQPYPDGILKLPLTSFVPAFDGIVTTVP